MSDTHKTLVIGLFGFGVVGEGVYKVLKQTPSLKATIKKVCIKNPEKERDGPAELFTTDKRELLDDAEINVIVEVINDADAAFEIVSEAMTNKKSVVSASKKMIAEHLCELLILQQATKMSLLYEAAAGASIPIIRNLEEYYDNDLLHSMRAIVNGSTNFILTKMFTGNLNYFQALLLAKQLGFAETDPVLDVEGHDAAHKWSFLLTHAFGIVVNHHTLVYTGIQRIDAGDARFAAEKEYEIKLVAEAKKMENDMIAAFVLPQFVNKTDPLAFVRDENNGVVIESGFADRQFFYGKGAGSFPTASAILSDLSALRYDYKYEYKKLYHHAPCSLSNDFFLEVYVSYDSVRHVPTEQFAIIRTTHRRQDRCYLIGTISFKTLQNSTWWRDPDISLIVMPDGVNHAAAAQLKLSAHRSVEENKYEYFPR
ncbi:MAG TPA: homoserine dehydrogenase [Puia sp.]|nr:homoserine dehydrogenase [Puia sp.]